MHIYIVQNYITNVPACLTLANTIYKLPEDGAEAPKHVGAFVI